VLFCLGDGDGEEQDALTLPQTAARDFTEKELLDEARVVLLFEAIGFSWKLGLLLGIETHEAALTWLPCRTIEARVGVDEPTLGRGMLLERDVWRGNASLEGGLLPAVDGRKPLRAVGRVDRRRELFGGKGACPDTVCLGRIEVLRGGAMAVDSEVTF
jgi:hypothetical protein